MDTRALVAVLRETADLLRSYAVDQVQPVNQRSDQLRSEIYQLSRAL